MSEGIRGSFATKFGEVQYTLWDEHTVVFVAGRADDDKPLLVNGVAYTLRAEMNLKEDGSWDFSSGYPDLSRLHAYKNGKWDWSPTPAARSSIRKELRERWSEHIDPADLKKAEIAAAEREVERLDAKRNGLLAEAAEVLIELDAARQKLTDLTAS